MDHPWWEASVMENVEGRALVCRKRYTMLCWSWICIHWWCSAWVIECNVWLQRCRGGQSRRRGSVRGIQLNRLEVWPCIRIGRRSPPVRSRRPSQARHGGVTSMLHGWNDPGKKVSENPKAEETKTSTMLKEKQCQVMYKRRCHKSRVRHQNSVVEKTRITR